MALWVEVGGGEADISDAVISYFQDLLRLLLVLLDLLGQTLGRFSNLLGVFSAE